jgi:hypothetical protein
MTLTLFYITETAMDQTIVTEDLIPELGGFCTRMKITIDIQSWDCHGS